MEAKMWTCSMPGCGASYVKRGDLTEHYKSMHMEGERWKCYVPGCGASFSHPNKAKLKQHILKKHAAPGPVARARPGAPSTAAGPSRVASGGDEGKAKNASLELAKMWKKKYEKARKKVEKLKAKIATLTEKRGLQSQGLGPVGEGERGTKRAREEEDGGLGEEEGGDELLDEEEEEDDAEHAELESKRRRQDEHLVGDSAGDAGAPPEDAEDVEIRALDGDLE